jgi:N-methylhydantoinase B
LEGFQQDLDVVDNRASLRGLPNGCSQVLKTRAFETHSLCVSGGTTMAAKRSKVDPITLSVVRGILETTQREMTLALEKTARSSVFNLAHDYSTALFNAKPEMILQGQDIPIHLGSLIPAMKAVAKFFGDDIHEGDLIMHNDPAFGGSHAIDTCVYKPVFYKKKLVYWTVCKGHLTGYRRASACGL